MRLSGEREYDTFKAIGAIVCLLIFLFFMWLGAGREYTIFNKAKQEGRVIWHTNYVPVVSYEIIPKGD